MIVRLYKLRRRYLARVLSYTYLWRTAHKLVGLTILFTRARCASAITGKPIARATVQWVLSGATRRLPDPYGGNSACRARVYRSGECRSNSVSIVDTWDSSIS